MPLLNDGFRQEWLALSKAQQKSLLKSRKPTYAVDTLTRGREYLARLKDRRAAADLVYCYRIRGNRFRGQEKWLALKLARKVYHAVGQSHKGEPISQ